MRKGVRRQLFLAICGSLATFCGGIAFTWLSPFIVDLTSEKKESTVPRLSLSQISLALSMLDVGSLLSPLPIGFLVNKYGRKPILILGGPIFISSWIVVLTTNSYGSLLFGRLLQGMAIGIVFSVLPMYLGEVSEKKIRGRIGLMIQGMSTLGMVFIFIIGPFCTYYQVAWISMIPAVLFTLCAFWFPESPFYLTMKGLWKEGKASLKWYRGGEDVTDEFNEISRSVMEEKGRKADWKGLINTKEGRKGILAIESVILGFEMGGAVAIVNYSSMIFNETSGKNSSIHQIYPMILSSLVLFLYPIPVLTVERYGRRSLILVSLLAAGMFHLVSTIYYYFYPIYSAVPPPYISWIPYLTVIVSTVTLICGAVSVTHILQAELFPNSTRGVAGGLVILSERLLSIVTLNIFPVLIDWQGIYFNFLVYSVFSFLSYALVYFFLPETKGKSFDMIQHSIQ